MIINGLGYLARSGPPTNLQTFAEIRSVFDLRESAVHSGGLAQISDARGELSEESSLQKVQLSPGRPAKDGTREPGIFANLAHGDH